jgi:histidinol-phosphate aminotransferase
LASQLSEAARYPDGSGFILKSQISDKLQVPEDSIILGNGSNDILEMAAMAFLNGDQSAVYSEFCFVVNKLATQGRGAEGLEVPSKEFGHDLERMLETVQDNTKIIFVSNPNNPTGTFISPEDILRFIEQVPSNVVVILDEAYYEYLPAELQSASVSWINRFPNLLVTRTFSKIYGLASLRVGYGMANPELANILNRVRQPFNVNSFGLAAAAVALKDDAFVSASVAVNNEGMKALLSSIEGLGLKYIPSYGNFLTVEFEQEGIEIYQRLLRRGIITRPVGGYNLANHLRISIGIENENTRFIEALHAVMRDLRL